MEAMEEWGHADDRVIQRSYTAEVCISCAWFTYGMDAHCHTLLGCTLRRGLLQHGEHLTRQCEHWASVTEVDVGGTVAA